MCFRYSGLFWSYFIIKQRNSWSLIHELTFFELFSEINTNYWIVSFSTQNTINLPFHLQKRSKCILQSIIGKCRNQCITFATANATFDLQQRVFCIAFGWRFVPLFVLLNDFLVRQSIHIDSVACRVVRYFACGQLLTHFVGRKLQFPIFNCFESFDLRFV